MNKRIWIAMLYLAVWIPNTQAQPAATQELRWELEKLAIRGVKPTDTLYIKALNDLAFGYQRIHPDSALLLAEQSDSLSLRSGYDKGRVEALRNKGIVYYLKGNYPQALQYYLDALRLAEKIKDLTGVGRLYNNTALIYFSQGKYDEALDHQMRSLEVKRQINDKTGIATSLNNIGNIYKNQKRFKESLAYHFEALKAREELNDTRSVAASLNNIGWLYLQQDSIAQALQYLQRALPLYESTQDKTIGSDVAQGLAECYLASGKPEKALAYGLQGLAIAESIQLTEQLRDCNETLSKIYKALGRFEKALQHHEAFKKYADQITNMEVEKRTASLEAEFEYQQREAALLAAQLQREGVFQKKSLQQTWLIVGVLAVLIFVTVLAWVIARNSRKLRVANAALEQTNTALAESTDELQATNEELQQQKEEIAAQRDLVARQNEKLRMATEVIARQLEEIKSKNENLEEEVRKRTLELVQNNEQLEQFAFLSAHNLRAPVARILGLGNLLKLFPAHTPEREDVVEKLVATTSELDEVVRDLNAILEVNKNQVLTFTETDLQVPLNKALSQLENEIVQTGTVIHTDFTQVPALQTHEPYLESIFFNLISNAIKYRHGSRKPSIEISSQVVGKNVLITVKDNGLGIDMEQFKDKVFTLYSRFHTHGKGKGLGLYLIKNQVLALGGTINLVSHVNQGSEFEILLPIARSYS